MSRVFLDTNILIYLIEDAGSNGRKAVALLERMTKRKDIVCTSTLTLGELLVKPLEHGNAALAAAYESALNSPGMILLDFDSKASRAYAEIRQDKSIRAPDAIQLAVAASAGCDLFVTNDDRLTKKIIRGIHFITSFDNIPF
jgi:predicted nucleic acid-binding protein